MQTKRLLADLVRLRQRMMDLEAGVLEAYPLTRTPSRSRSSGAGLTSRTRDGAAEFAAHHAGMRRDCP